MANCDKCGEPIMLADVPAEAGSTLHAVSSGRRHFHPKCWPHQSDLFVHIDTVTHEHAAHKERTALNIWKLRTALLQAAVDIAAVRDASNADACNSALKRIQAALGNG